MPKAATDITMGITITTATITIMADALLPLLVWLSPSFPTGAFAYSHGLEWAVEVGDVHDAMSLAGWLADLVAHGAMRADSILLASVFAGTTRDRLALNELALALSSARERRLETTTQGNAFLLAVQGAWPAPAIADFAAALAEADVAYPIAVGTAAAAHGLGPRPTLEAFALAAIGNLVSAAVRLGPIGQSEAQAIIAKLCPSVSRLAAFAATATLDDLGTATWRCDIAGMRHETQYSRLFRS